MQRRSFIVIAAIAPLAACGASDVKVFPTLAAASKAVEALAEGHRKSGAWSLAQMLQHAAQSIEYSMDGFPAPKSAFFRATVGPAAFAFFDARGAMSHGLDEPIPGAPALDAATALPAAIARALAAVKRFESHTGALAPHFAYGALDKAQYTRAHLMHLANHWSEITRT